MLPVIDYKDAAPYVTRKQVRLGEAETMVAPILAAVRARGDAAVLEYARKFDGLDGDSVVVSRGECSQAMASWSKQFREAVEVASSNVREYALSQLPHNSMREYSAGRWLGQIIRPLDSIAET